MSTSYYDYVSLVDFWFFFFLFLISSSVRLTWLVDINKYLPRTQMGWFLTPQVWMIVWPLIEAQTMTVCEPLAECCSLQTLEMFLFFFLKIFTFFLFLCLLSRVEETTWGGTAALHRHVKVCHPQKTLIYSVNVLASCRNSFPCVGHFLVFRRWHVKLHVILHWQSQILQSRGRLMFDHSNISRAFWSGWYVKAEKSDPEEVK